MHNSASTLLKMHDKCTMIKLQYIYNNSFGNNNQMFNYIMRVFCRLNKDEILMWVDVIFLKEVLTFETSLSIIFLVLSVLNFCY